MTRIRRQDEVQEDLSRKTQSHDVPISEFPRNDMSRKIDEIIWFCEDEKCWLENEILYLKEKIDYLDWQKFQTMAPLSYYLRLETRNHFDKVIGQLDNQID